MQKDPLLAIVKREFADIVHIGKPAVSRVVKVQ